MRPMTLTAIAAGALVACAAIAQPAPLPPGGPDGGPPPREMDGPGGHREPGYMRGRFMRPQPPKGAFFRFRHGDDSVTVKCAEDEPTKACTDGVAAMMQAIRANPPAK